MWARLIIAEKMLAQHNNNIKRVSKELIHIAVVVRLRRFNYKEFIVLGSKTKICHILVYYVNEEDVPPNTTEQLKTVRKEQDQQTLIIKCVKGSFSTVQQSIYV